MRKSVRLPGVLTRSASALAGACDRLGLGRLPNGIRVASINTPGPCIGAGVMLETKRSGRLPPVPQYTASRYVLEKLAFKATQNLSEERMHAKLDELVGAVQAKSTRDALFYSGTVVPSHLAPLLELLKEVVAAPLVTAADLDEIRAVVEYELMEMKNKPDELLPELVLGPALYSHLQGGGRNGGGHDQQCASSRQGESAHMMDYNSILGVPADLEGSSVERVMEFWRATCLPENLIVVGAGVQHGELYNAAQDTFGKLEALPNPATAGEGAPAEYVGGANYIENDSAPLTHMAVGFEGAAAGSERSFPLAVLQMLMGGGSSFSAGGPGKGMYSRLYTQVLNRYHWIESCKVFNLGQRTAGIFGIHGSALPSQARDLADVLLEQLHGMTAPLTQIELSRAKSQVKSAVLMGLESRMVELEDLADQISHLDKYMPPREICARVDAVSAEELQELAAQLLRSKPTVVVYGPLHRAPSYDAILKWNRTLLDGTRK